MHVNSLCETSFVCSCKVETKWIDPSNSSIWLKLLLWGIFEQPGLSLALHISNFNRSNSASTSVLFATEFSLVVHHKTNNQQPIMDRHTDHYTEISLFLPDTACGLVNNPFHSNKAASSWGLRIQKVLLKHIFVYANEPCLPLSCLLDILWPELLD